MRSKKRSVLYKIYKMKNFKIKWKKFNKTLPIYGIINSILKTRGEIIIEE